jgi:ATP-dependent RNA helicase DDX24/MAK5
LFLT